MSQVLHKEGLGLHEAAYTQFESLTAISLQKLQLWLAYISSFLFHHVLHQFCRLSKQNENPKLTREM